MEETIKQILSNLKVDNQDIEIAHIQYTGKKRTYVVWTMLNEQPEMCGDDDALYSTVPVDIDIYSETNYLAILKEIKKRMKENEWIWTGDSEEMYENDTGLYHKTSSFEKEREI